MRPRLILFCGIPGSGKTTVATGVSARLEGSVFVQTDRIRAMIDSPAYTSPESKFVYAALIAVGREALNSGYDTLLEGTFPREEYRGEALAELSPLATKTTVVYVFCEPELAFGRNAGRKEAVPWESFRRIYEQFEEPRGAVRVDTGMESPEASVEHILSELKR
jgi:predicted kinase